jgi:hypothetical protein
MTRRLFAGGLAVILNLALAASVGPTSGLALAGSPTTPVDSGNGMTQAQIQQGLTAIAALNQELAAKGMSPNSVGGAYYGWLNVPYIEQHTTYWCGPAAVAELIDWMGYSQGQTAIANYMGTTTSGTNFSEIPLAINHFTAGSGASYVNYGSSGQAYSTYSTNWQNAMYNDILIRGNRPLIQDALIGTGNGIYYLYGYQGNMQGNEWHYLTSDGLQNGYSAGYAANYDDSNDVVLQALGQHWWDATQVMSDSYYGNGLTWANG